MTKMNIKTSLFTAAIILMALTLQGMENLKPERQITYEDEIYGRFSGALLDKDSDLIASFYATPLRLFTPEKSVQFATMGQGPDQLINLWAQCLYNDDLALFEMPNKIKIFTKKDGTYVWKETKWLKRGPYLHVPSSAVFLDNKWFIAGSSFHDMGGKDSPVSFVTVYGADGTLVNELIDKKFDKPFMHMQLNYFILAADSKAYFLPENELKVTVIDPVELKVTKEVSLESPEYYKPMPPDFYLIDTPEKQKDFLKQLEYWRYSYSRLSAAAVDSGYLIVQFRVFGEKMKKFALLFYNLGNFKLEKTVLTNDCFMTAGNGKYYFYADGDPGYDEEAGKTVIKVFSLEDKK